MASPPISVVYRVPPWTTSKSDPIAARMGQWTEYDTVMVAPSVEKITSRTRPRVISSQLDANPESLTEATWPVIPSKTSEFVATYYGGSSDLHDVYVRDGLAFLSHTDAGLIILDVGNGVAGGLPTDPVEVGRVRTVGGSTHNAWYWPDAGYVFVGEESDRPGVLHVVDVSDLSNPWRSPPSRLSEETRTTSGWMRRAAFSTWHGGGKDSSPLTLVESFLANSRPRDGKSASITSLETVGLPNCTTAWST